MDSQTLMNMSLNSTKKVMNQIIDFSNERWGKDENDQYLFRKGQPFSLQSFIDDPMTPEMQQYLINKLNENLGITDQEILPNNGMDVTENHETCLEGGDDFKIQHEQFDGVKDYSIMDYNETINPTNNI